MHTSVHRGTPPPQNPRKKKFVYALGPGDESPRLLPAPPPRPVFLDIGLGGVAWPAQGLQVRHVVSAALGLWGDVVTEGGEWLVTNRGDLAVTQALLAKPVVAPQNIDAQLIPLAAVATSVAAAPVFVGERSGCRPLVGDAISGAIINQLAAARIPTGTLG